MQRMRLRVLMLVALVISSGCAPTSPGRTGDVGNIRVQEAGFVRIGGIDQWITVRGDDRKLPVLLIVHGGPGDAQSPLVSTYAPYERDFIIVQWDQRGAGRTFARNRDADQELSLERMASDGVEVAQYLARHLQRQRIIVLGHSWGSTLGLEMVKRRPDLFEAYVGTGQVSSWQASVTEQWSALESRARAAQDQETLAKLQAIGKPDPMNVPQYFSWRTVLNRKYLGAADARWLAELRTMNAERLGLTEEELKATSAGATFSGTALIKVMTQIDLFASARNIPIPFFVIQGSEDLYTPTAPAARYFETVEAPTKKLTIIDGAGHFAIATHPQEFRAALVDSLKPLGALSIRIDRRGGLLR